MVMIPQLPYGVETDKKIVYPAEAWCRDQWGPRWEVTGNRAGSWCVFWGGSGTLIPYSYQWWFATEQQQTLFMLKWS